MLNTLLSFILGTFFGNIALQENFKVKLESLENPGQQIEVSASEAASDYGISIDIEKLDAKRRSLRYRVSVTNNGNGYAVAGLEGPSVTGLKFKDEGYELVHSSAGGRRMPLSTFDKREDGFSITTTGDGNKGTMYWFAFAGEKKGVYAACENKECLNIYNIVSYDKESGIYSISQKQAFYCHPGEKYSSPVVDVHPYRGDWHVAADTYRRWYDSCHTIARHPDWLRNASGWMLTILKQQNGQVLWPYNTIGKEMCDEALSRGLNVLGLYGRAVGGHDSLYPDYSSDPTLGGEEELKKGIAEMHSRGLHCIIYVNGQLVDKETEWWEQTGKDWSVMMADGSLKTDSYKKFSNGRNVVHTLACMKTEFWQDMMIKMAEDANALGADGIIFDQLGRVRNRVCYNPEHGHKVPDLVYQQDLLQALEKVYAHMQEINPDFVLMTEGFMDMQLPSVAFYHRGSMGRIISQKDMEDMASHSGMGYAAPEVLLYTFPEMVNTSNDPAPQNLRQRLNLNAVFNERTEIEVRYDFDKDLVVNDRKQSLSCFDIINDSDSKNGKYHQAMVSKFDPAESHKYSKEIHSWLSSYPELMREGRFVDTKGFSISTGSPLLIAKAYLSKDGKEMGVIVWNVSPKDSAEFSIKPGSRFKLREATAPDCSIKPGDPIAPESVQIYIYDKK